MSYNDYAELKSNVLSSNFKWFGDRDVFFKVVVQTGYPFFSWNGRVYKVENDQMHYTDTGKLIEDFE